MSNEQIRLRELLRRDVIHPEALLVGVARAGYTPARWRESGFKELRQMYDACLFAYALAKWHRTDVTVLRGEVEDYDCALRSVSNGEILVAGVQIKELPPAELNAKISLPVFLQGLATKPPTDAWLLLRL